MKNVIHKKGTTCIF